MFLGGSLKVVRVFSGSGLCVQVAPLLGKEYVAAMIQGKVYNESGKSDS